MNKIDKSKLEYLKGSLTEKDYNDLKEFMNLMDTKYVKEGEKCID